LGTHLPHHVKGLTRFAPQGCFEYIFLDSRFQGRLHRVVDFKEAVRWTQSADTLVRSAVIVVFYPQRDSLPGFHKVLKLCPVQKLLQDALPEALNLAQGHRVMRLTAQVMDLIFFQFTLELGLATPGCILAPVVGEHFLWAAVVANRSAIGFQHRLTGLASIKLQSHDVARVIIQVANQVHRLPIHPEAHDITLPELVWRAPLKEPRLSRVSLRFFPRRLRYHIRFRERPMHRARGCLHQKHPPQDVTDSTDSVVRVFTL
jgi:hypothetical protein